MHGKELATWEQRLRQDTATPTAGQKSTASLDQPEITQAYIAQLEVTAVLQQLHGQLTLL